MSRYLCIDFGTKPYAISPSFMAQNYAPLGADDAHALHAIERMRDGMRDMREMSE